MVRDFKKRLNKIVNECPPFDAIWLNGTETSKGRAVSANLKTVNKMWGTFGYVIGSSFYDVAIEGFTGCITSADEFYTSIQKDYRIYAPIIPLVKHKKGVSDIALRVLNYDHLI